ncbi:hypothetical protein HYQ44_005866 [Verticillium longisporum]|nr:hypothetical protein HYQ44_005866 [Verticillium longisporum]
MVPIGGSCWYKSSNQTPHTYLITRSSLRLKMSGEGFKIPNNEEEERIRRAAEASARRQEEVKLISYSSLIGERLLSFVSSLLVIGVATAVSVNTTSENVLELELIAAVTSVVVIANLDDFVTKSTILPEPDAW